MRDTSGSDPAPAQRVASDALCFDLNDSPSRLSASCDEASSDSKSTAACQFAWKSRLAQVRGAHIEPISVAIATPTSSTLQYYIDNHANDALFNVGLLGDPAGPPVPVAAVDLANHSAWFQRCLDHQGVMGGGSLTRVVVPCAVPTALLRSMVCALYAGRLTLDAATVEGVYRAADAMEMPAIMAACEAYLQSSAIAPGDALEWAAAAFDLGADLYRPTLCDAIAAHYAAAAQRDAAGVAPILRHILCSEGYAADGRKQLALLRAGHTAAWRGQGPELLLLHVLMEVEDALCVDQLPAVLDMVAWDTLQPEEVLVLADWVLGIPTTSPLAAPLRERALRCVAAQRCFRPGRQYMVLKADVGRLPSSGTRLMSSQALSLKRRLYLCMERASNADWGLFLCPPPDTPLGEHVRSHTLFALGADFRRRVAVVDVAISADLKKGAGYGSRSAVSDWIAGGMAKQLGDGMRLLTVGTIATELAPCSSGQAEPPCCDLEALV